MSGSRRSAEAVGSAPGRVNLIGEHTDYNGGYVLPTVLPHHTSVAVRARDDALVRVCSAEASAGEVVEYALGTEDPVGDWTDYVRGVTRVLAERATLSGFDAQVESDVPIGRGLASSAALTVALQRALRELFELPLDDMAVARNGQRVENEFVGARVGIMDPLVSSLGREGEALFVDTRDLSLRRLPIPTSIELVVVDSGIEHRHATGAYNERRRECEEAARRLGVADLRELSAADLTRSDRLADPLARRVRHVVTENARVLGAVEALETPDAERLGALISESHRSLRDDFEVSTPEIDALVRDLDDQPSVLGARITGGGFGGAVLVVARPGRGLEAACSALARRPEWSGAAPLLVTRDPERTPRAERRPRAASPASRGEPRPKPAEARAADIPSSEYRVDPTARARQPGTREARLFGDPVFGGFECSVHLLRSGRRLDLIESTRHEELAGLDYRRMRAMGMGTARDGARWTRIETSPGRYDFSSAQPMVAAALEEGVRVVWDLLHFGWPDHVDPMAPEFPERFGDFVGGFLELLREEGDREPAICPVNEISFLSFAGGQAGFFNPFLHGRGDDLKAQLVRASLEGCRRALAIAPNVRLVHTDPVIHVLARPDRPQDRAAAENHRQAQFHAWDMISGAREPELGGRPEYLDVIGVNYYVHNQWYYPGGHGSMIDPSSGRWRPLHQLLLDVHQRYGRPIFIAETGIEDEARPAWLAYVGHEARAAIRAGVDLRGICLYPIVNHPGWEDDRHCHNGLWDYADSNGARPVYVPLADEIERQRLAFDRMQVAPELPEDVDALRRSLDEIGRSIAEKTEESRAG